MNIEKELKKEGIEVIVELDSLITRNISKNISRRIVETFPNFDFTEKEIFKKLSTLKMYRAKMTEGMAEANYYYKNSSIYFNEHLSVEDLEEFAIHECIHFLQEIKDEKNNLIKMGLCNYKNGKSSSIGLNEAAVQTTSAFIIGVEPDYEKYYNINLYTPSPSYYPVECSLLNQITYFTGKEVLYRSTIFASDDFKNRIIEMSSEKMYRFIEVCFDEILLFEETIIKIRNRISMLEDGNPKAEILNNRIEKLKNKIATKYILLQNNIIKQFFDYEYSKIITLEDVENMRHRLTDFKTIVGSVNKYYFFDDYFKVAMNKLEHKTNILENGGFETAICETAKNPIIDFFRKIFGLINKKLEMK